MSEQCDYDLNQGHEDDAQLYNDYEEEELIQVQGEKDFEIVDFNKIYDHMVKVANNVSMISGLGFGWSLLLLREFNWDETQVQYQYYNITENIHIKIGYTKEYSEPEQVRREVYGTCDVCLEPDREMIFNICNHCYCLDCWVYSITQKNNPFFDCMEVGCGVPVLAETVIGILSLAKNGKELTSKYHRMLCEHFCSTNDKYKFCTGTNCQNVIKVNRSGLEVVKCNCGTVFCFICQNEDHSPCNCQQRRKWIGEVISNEADAKWIALNSKLCPWCKKAVERSAGCNYMACRCGKSFCYLCEKPWQPDHRDHFRCHIYIPKKEEELDREKKALQMISHSAERFMFNQKTANLYRESLREQHNDEVKRQTCVATKRAILFDMLGVSLTDSEFINNAYQFAAECCERNKWIYAYIFFTPINDAKKKEEFDYAFGNYESFKEQMLKKLAVDLKIFIDDLVKRKDNQELTGHYLENRAMDFKVLKKEIVDFYTGTKKYQQFFMDKLRKMFEELQREKEDQEMKEYISRLSNPTKPKSQSSNKRSKKKSKN